MASSSRYSLRSPGKMKDTRIIIQILIVVTALIASALPVESGPLAEETPLQNASSFSGASDPVAVTKTNETLLSDVITTKEGTLGTDSVKQSNPRNAGVLDAIKGKFDDPPATPDPTGPAPEPPGSQYEAGLEFFKSPAYGSTVTGSTDEHESNVDTRDIPEIITFVKDKKIPPPPPTPTPPPPTYGSTVTGSTDEHESNVDTRDIPEIITFVKDKKMPPPPATPPPTTPPPPTPYGQQATSQEGPNVSQAPSGAYQSIPGQYATPMTNNPPGAYYANVPPQMHAEYPPPAYYSPPVMYAPPVYYAPMPSEYYSPQPLEYYPPPSYYTRPTEYYPSLPQHLAHGISEQLQPPILPGYYSPPPASLYYSPPLEYPNLQPQLRSRQSSNEPLEYYMPPQAEYYATAAGESYTPPAEYYVPPSTPEYYSPPPTPVYYSPPAEYYSPPPSPEYYSPPPSVVYYSSPPEYSPPPEYYTPEPEYYGPPLSSEYYSPPPSVYAPKPLYYSQPELFELPLQGKFYSPPPQREYYSPPPQRVYYEPPPQREYYYPPPQRVYYGPPPQREHYAPAVQRDYYARSTQREYYAPAVQQEYNAPPTQQEFYAPEPQREYYALPRQRDYYTPKLQPELLEPQPLGEYYAPALQPERFEPPPQPEYYAPPPQREYYAPALQPERFEPPPQPEYYAPPPQREYYAPALQPERFEPPPQPEYYAPSPQREYYAPALQPERFEPPPQPEYYAPSPQRVYFPPELQAGILEPPPQREYYAPAPIPTYYETPPAPTYNSQAPAYYSPPAENARPKQMPLTRPVHNPQESSRSIPSGRQVPYYKPAYQQDSYKKEVYPEYVNFDTVNYLELNETVNCGIFAAVNQELYEGAYSPLDYEKSYDQFGTALLTKDDLQAFGACPWRVLILDEYKNLLCQGVIIHNRQVLTLASCVESRPLDELRVRYGDWDVLNDKNEYEAYKNYETRICRVLPVTSSSSSYRYSGYKAALVLLQIEAIEDYDKYPQVKPICLPQWPSYSPYARPYASPSAYNRRSPGYNLPSGPPEHYSTPAYPPPPSYTPPLNSQEQSSESCWIAGWNASPNRDLENHEPPKCITNRKTYNPYDDDDYNTEESMTPRKALLKRLYPPPGTHSYKHGQDEVEHWIGVDGWDACAADKGAAIICFVDERKGYASPNYETPSDYYQGSPENPPQYPPNAYIREIQVKPAQEKQVRSRTVVVAIVKETTKCTDYKIRGKGYGSSSSDPYRNQQTGIITAIKVSHEDVHFIMDEFLEGALDLTCPAPKAVQAEPKFYPENNLRSPRPTFFNVLSRSASYATPPYRPQSYTSPSSRPLTSGPQPIRSSTSGPPLYRGPSSVSIIGSYSELPSGGRPAYRPR